MSKLKKLFGPYKNDIWKQLAQEIDADFIESRFLKDSKVEASVKEWTVTLDTFVVPVGKVFITYTRMRAPYVNKDGFRFKLYRKGFFSDLGKKMGMQDIDVGFPEFDDRFIIQSKDEHKLQRLFANPKLRELIDAQPDISLEVEDDDGWLSAKFPEGVDQLTFKVVGVIKDIELLKQLYVLFAETLNQLCLIDSAYEDDPNIIFK